MPLNRSFCCISRNAFCKGIIGLYLLHIVFLVFMRFLQKCLQWQGYSFVLIIVFFLRESNILTKLFNFFRTAVGFDWICAFWGSAGLPEKEPWIKRHLLQRPGYQTTNKSDVTAADEVCLANCWWNELLVRKICKLIKNTKDKQFRNLLVRSIVMLSSVLHRILCLLKIKPGSCKRILTVLLRLFL